MTLPPGFTGVETEAQFRARHAGHELAEIQTDQPIAPGHTVRYFHVRCAACAASILTKFEHFFAEDTKP